MGFERLIIYLTGVDNIRDVIPYFRTPQNCDF
jgi:asparaginyl-tRNA synthetase